MLRINHIALFVLITTLPLLLGASCQEADTPKAATTSLTEARASNQTTYEQICSDLNKEQETFGGYYNETRNSLDSMYASGNKGFQLGRAGAGLARDNANSGLNAVQASILPQVTVERREAAADRRFQELLESTRALESAIAEHSAKKKQLEENAVKLEALILERMKAEAENTPPPPTN